MTPGSIAVHTKKTLEKAQDVEGHLTDKETRFLSVLPFVNAQGEILEIGSFKGKSAIVLAYSARSAGKAKVHACDPLSLPSETDPSEISSEDLPAIFRRNIRQAGMSKIVELHQMKSVDLAPQWKRPIGILWIDGDHTYEGALADFERFFRHLSPGSIVAMHDVLHIHDGPVRVFVEKVVKSPAFGDCGVCGSIGWGQRVEKGLVNPGQWKAKKRLAKRLSRLIPFGIAHSQGRRVFKPLYELFRTLVPHGEIDPDRFVSQRNAAIAGADKLRTRP